MAIEEIGLFPIEMAIYEKQKGGSIQAHEGDKGGRGLLLTLKDNGEPFDSSGIDLRLGFKDANGEEKLYDFEPVAPLLGKFKINYPEEMLVEQGGKVVNVEVKAYESLTGQVINFTPLYVYVNPEMVSDGQLIDSQEGSVLLKTLAEVQAIGFGLAGIESTENERKNAEILRGTTEANRVTAETGRVNAETTRAGFYDGFTASLSALTTNVNAQLAETATRVTDLILSYGKNRFNRLTSTLNTLVQVTGLLNPSTGWSTSDFIEVPSSSSVAITLARFIVEYDASKKVISGSFVDVNPQAQRTITTKATTKYIKFSYLTSVALTNQVEIGSTSTAFAPFEYPVLKKSDGSELSIDVAESSRVDYKIDFGGKNRFDKLTAISDKVISADGNLSTSATWTTSAPIKINPLSQIVINKARFVAEYDKNKKFINGTYKDVSPEAITTFTTNSNTVYIRVTTATINLPTAQVEYGTSATAYEDPYYALYYGDTKVYDLKGWGSVMDSKLLTTEDYSQFVDREKYQIWKVDGSDTSKKRLIALYKDIAVSYQRSTAKIFISTTGINGAYDKSVTLTNVTLPNLIAGSKIDHAMIIPWTRNLTTGQIADSWRLILIMDRGQIYHNFPSRAVGSDGVALADDITKFDQSVVWDLPERKYPSTNQAASGVEAYFPGLPSEVYIYDPPLNADNGFANGGYDKQIIKNTVTYPRFYKPSTLALQNSFSPMGGFEPDDKITLLGTYKGNFSAGEAVRICVFATDDGKHWYTKYEFTTEDTVLNFANAINTSAFATAYASGLMAISKRGLVLPTEAVKEPVDKFTWGANVIVSNISRGSVAVVTTATAHGLTSGCVVAFKSNSGNDANWDWMKNDSVSVSSGGNGKLFKVKVLTSTTFELYEFVHSAFNNLPCRHIHHINRIKDGWLIGTGERYPNGWIMYMQMKSADTFVVKRAYEGFPIIRLTSSDQAVQRLIGATMFDDPDNTMIVAMDDETTPRDNVVMPSGRTETFTRSSTGVFRGKLADIDDLDKFTPVYEAKEVSYFFKEKGGVLIWIGQRGEFALSLDKGVTWQTEDLGEVGQHFSGESKKFIVVDNFVFVVK